MSSGRRIPSRRRSPCSILSSYRNSPHSCCHSHLQSKEAVSRCKARRRYMRELSEARQAFSIAHSLYLHFIRSAGSALLQFANAESHLHLPSPLPKIYSPPCHRTPPPLSPISDNWASSVTASPVLPPPAPPPPPPLLASCSWEFWNPFAPSSAHSVTEEGWEEAATSISSANAIPPEVVSGFPKDPSVELAVVSVSRGKKNFSEIVNELNEYFSKASETGKRVSLVLETPI